jgi:hypothetical protein
MDELEISGKRYISTKRAAREHGYHSDYMGQLIRGKKVAGQKVGRAWYIEEDSLNAYLGKAPIPAPVRVVIPAPAAEIVPPPAPAPAPVGGLVAEEPASIAPEPQPIAEISMPEPVAVPKAQEPVAEIAEEMEAEEIREEAQPVAVRIQPQAEPAYKPVENKIYHPPFAPFIEERETRAPAHASAPVMQERGGLRYTADDSVPMPIAARMPQTHAPAYAPRTAAAPQASGKFPYVGLCVVAAFAIVAAVFASNFVSATVVSEQGKAATVQYAIHW